MQTFLNKFIQGERTGAGSVLVWLAYQRNGKKLIVEDWSILSGKGFEAARPFWEDMANKGWVEIVK